MTHEDARQALLMLVDDPADVAALSLLVEYVEQQERLDRLDNASVARIASAAERRADEALARIGTLNDDLRDLRASIAAQR